jgi:predicted TIM-barrel fold metal-dependent hydrolase
MRVISLEEHFVTESFLRATGAYGKAAPPQLAELQPQLLDLGAGRIEAMDAAGIDFQILSLAAIGFDALDGATATTLARDVNDEVAAAVDANPTRLGAFATLALKEPMSAARELERCVEKLNFRGALLDGTTDGLFLDDPRFVPVFEAAESLKVPIYLHPAPPPESVYKAYFSGLAGELGHILSIAGWGGMRSRLCIRCGLLFRASSIGCPVCN